MRDSSISWSFYWFLPCLSGLWLWGYTHCNVIFEFQYSLRFSVWFFVIFKLLCICWCEHEAILFFYKTSSITSNKKIDEFFLWNKKYLRSLIYWENQRLFNCNALSQFIYTFKTICLPLSVMKLYILEWSYSSQYLGEWGWGYSLHKP